MIDKKFEVAQEEVLVVDRGLEVGFEEFFGELDVPEILNHELCIFNDYVGDDVDVGCEYG